MGKKWEFISLETFFIILVIGLLGLLLRIRAMSGVTLLPIPDFMLAILALQNIGEFLHGEWILGVSLILTIIAVIMNVAFYFAILIDIIRKGARIGWIVGWVIFLFLSIVTQLPGVGSIGSSIFALIYLLAGRARVTEKTFLEKANINLNFSDLKAIELLDRPIIKKDQKGDDSNQFCSQCGTKIEPESKYCSKCGKKIIASQ